MPTSEFVEDTLGLSKCHRTLAFIINFTEATDFDRPGVNSNRGPLWVTGC